MMLLRLPVELLFRILSFFDVKDLVTLSEVNKKFLILTRDDYLWTPLLRRDHPYTKKMRTSYLTYRYATLPFMTLKLRLIYGNISPNYRNVQFYTE